MEKVLAPLSDCLVTINEEDYEFAKRKRLSGGDIFHIDGVGVDLARFRPATGDEKLRLREKYGIGKNDFVALFIGRPTPDKNHEMMLTAVPEILKDVPELKVICAGAGELMNHCIKRAEELGISNHVQFIGPRSDIPDLCRAADIHISTSAREGLATGNIEAMATGCPLVISDIRGHRDVCKENRNGFLFRLDDPVKFIDSVRRLAHDTKLRSEISENNIKDAERFSVIREVECMARIYEPFMAHTNTD